MTAVFNTVSNTALSKQYDLRLKAVLPNSDLTDGTSGINYCTVYVMFYLAPTFIFF